MMTAKASATLLEAFFLLTAGTWRHYFTTAVHVMWRKYWEQSHRHCQNFATTCEKPCLPFLWSKVCFMSVWMLLCPGSWRTSFPEIIWPMRWVDWFCCHGYSLYLQGLCRSRVCV